MWVLTIMDILLAPYTKTVSFNKCKCSYFNKPNEECEEVFHIWDMTNKECYGIGYELTKDSLKIYNKKLISDLIELGPLPYNWIIKSLNLKINYKDKEYKNGRIEGISFSEFTAVRGTNKNSTGYHFFFEGRK